MANYELITIKKGEIKSVDSFIKNFNAIGANMKALSVSAYKFLTSEDKELKKDFQIRVMDELGMTKATLSYLKTAGWLYLLDDRFSEFAYTNVIYFKKAINYFTEKHDVEINEETITTLFRELATLHISTLTEGYVESLVELSQKELNNLINKYIAEKVEPEATEEVEPEVTEEAEPEVEASFYNIIDEDYFYILDLLRTVTNKSSKTDLLDRMNKINEILSGYNN